MLVVYYCAVDISDYIVLSRCKVCSIVIFSGGRPCLRISYMQNSSKEFRSYCHCQIVLHVSFFVLFYASTILHNKFSRVLRTT